MKGCVLNESSTDYAKCCRNVKSERRDAVAIWFLVNARGLQLQCDRVLCKAMLVPGLMYSSEKMIWKEKERSRIKAVEMDILIGLLGIKRNNKVPNVRITWSCME